MIKILAFLLYAFAVPILAQTPVKASNKILARVALLSDTHTTRATTGDQAAYKGHLDRAIEAVNATKVDVVLIAGDLTKSGKAEEMDDFQSQIKRFEAPVWFVPGNHDVGNKLNSGKEDRITSERVQNYEKKLGASFFARKRSGVRVIGVNSPLLGSGLPREAEMWKLLEKELSLPGRTPVIVFSHYPLFVGAADEPGGAYWNIEPEPRRRLLALLRRAGVKTVLSGHLHRLLVNRNDGILFLTTPPISFGLPKGKQPEGWTLITVPKTGEVQFEFQTIK